VATARPYRDLLEAAGFTQATETDHTAEFAAITQAWIQHWDANHDDMVALLGVAAVSQRQAEQRAQFCATEDGFRRLGGAVRPRPGLRSRRRHAGRGGPAVFPCDPDAAPGGACGACAPVV
jgi:hypothetical protein